MLWRLLKKRSRCSYKVKYCRISIEKSPKQGFRDISTLHAKIEVPIDDNFLGTEFELNGVTEDEVEAAKKLFLKFSDDEIIETTRQDKLSNEMEIIAIFI